MLEGSNKDRSRYTNKYPFLGKIYCSECGAPFGKNSCSMPAGNEEKLQEAFVRIANQLITDRDQLVKCMMENIENDFNEQVSKVDTEIYCEENRRITSEMEDLRSKRSIDVPG
jgi:site-specific DNA recombinase